MHRFMIIIPMLRISHTLGTVENVDERGFAKIEQKNKFSVGEMIEIMKPDGRNLQVEVKGIYDAQGQAQESAPHPKQEVIH